MNRQLSYLVLGLTLHFCGLPASAQSPALRFERTNGIPSKLLWQTEIGKSYDLWQSPDLLVWNHVDGFPQDGTGLDMSFSFTATTRGFFRIGVITSGELALIPAGSFQMGDQSSPLVGIIDELPVHSVQVSDFYIGKYEVTKELWDSVQAWALGNGYTDLPAGGGKAANHPVHSIDWYAMVKWCNARSEKEGLTPCYTVSGATYKVGNNNTVVCNWNANGYRLPSEAEWEKAARGGLNAKNFPLGDTITHAQANYDSSSLYSYDVSPTRGYHPTYAVGGFPYSSPVGSFAPNGYGLYDMTGNMLEWCWDFYGSGYTADAQTDPRGSATGTERVFRGGGWIYTADDCRVSARIPLIPVSSSNYFGFRVARSLTP